MSIINYISGRKKILVLEYWLMNNKSPTTKEMMVELGLSRTTIDKIKREYRLEGTITIKSTLSRPC